MKQTLLCAYPITENKMGNSNSNGYPSISILILNYNGRKHLRKCLSSIINNTNYPRYEIYLVDNGSKDGSIEYVNKFYPRVKIISLKKNYGFSTAYNKAVNIIKNEFIVFLNNDTYVTNNWLLELFNKIKKDKKVAVVGSKLLFMDRPDIIQHEGAKLTIIGGGFDINFLKRSEVIKDIAGKQEVGAVCGAAMLIRRDVFIKLGGFDEDFFAYFEDTDYCWRCWLNGFKVLYAPLSIVLHKFGGSWGKIESPARIYLGQRNRIYSMLKNLEIKTLLGALVILFLYSTIKLIIFLKRKKKSAILPLISGTVSGFKELRKMIIKRQKIQSSRKVSDDWLIKNCLIATLKESLIEFRRLSKVSQI